MKKSNIHKTFFIKKEGYWWVEEKKKWTKNPSGKISSNMRSFNNRIEAIRHGLRLKGRVLLIEWIFKNGKFQDATVYKLTL